MSSGAFAGGFKKDFLIVFSTCYPTNSIGRSYRWMARSCKPMPRPPGRKKGLLRRHRAFKGGLTSKIVARTDAIGTLIRFVVLPGQSHDRVALPMLLDPVDFTTWIGDTAFDSDALLDRLAEHGVKTVIPPKKNRTLPRTFDRDAYRDRHRIENVFCKIKEFRAIATRYDKMASRFAAGIHLVAGIIAAR